MADTFAESGETDELRQKYGAHVQRMLPPGQDVIVGTGLGQFPNAIEDLLSFPYILRGALDVQATCITEGMLLAASRALAELARE